MTDWQTGYVNANGLNLHYYRTGGDKPPLVLSHGATDDGLCWTPVAKALQDDYDVIMLDARGHGLSDSGQGEYGSDARAADLAGAIQALDLEKPVIGGHSMGADSSMHVAIQQPGLVGGIFLEDPPLVRPGEPVFGGEMGENLEKGYKIFQRAMLLFKVVPLFIGARLARKINPAYPDDEILPWVRSKKRLSADFRKSMTDMADMRPPYDLLKQVNIPTLLVVGDREKGAIVSHQAALETTSDLPNFQIAHFPGASHDIRRFDFDQYIHVLRFFLVQIF